jgi:predicted transcriptional regulator
MTMQCVKEPTTALELDVATTVEEARAVMARTGQSLVLVHARGFPVGVVTCQDLEGTAERRPKGNARLDAIMTKELVVTDPGADLRTTLGTYTDHAWQSLFRRAPCGSVAMCRRQAAFEPVDPARDRLQLVR